MAQNRFPDARNLGLFTASLLDGGGRHTETDISKTEVSAVISWFEDQLGPVTTRFDDGVVWQRKTPGRVVEEVWVKPFAPSDIEAVSKLGTEEMGAYRTTIVYEYHVLPKPAWRQFWKRG